MSKEKKRWQMSESFPTILILTLSGGFQDAYTYIDRGHVFANAQTGNIVLMAVSLLSGAFKTAAMYLVPIISFMAGILCAEVIHQHCKERKKVHWRQIIVGTEVILLFLVGFIPTTLNPLANAIVSFVCAMQVEAFRKLRGRAIASTMCIGNMRTGTENLYHYISKKDRKYLHNVLHYFVVILIFAIGAGLGGVLTLHLGTKTIWISSILLAISFLTMLIDTEKDS